MSNRLFDWLLAEPVPGDLRRRVMGDPRLATSGGSAFRSRLAFATAALVVMVLGAGLGSILLRGSHPSGVVAQVHPSPSLTPPDLAPAVTPPVTPTAAPGTTPAATPQPSQSPSVPKCRTADLTISITMTNGAAGTIYDRFVAINHTAEPCTVFGYFGLALIDAAGKPMGNDPGRVPLLGGFPGPSAPTLLAPGRGVSFDYGWGDNPINGQPCPQASQVELTAPNQYDHAFIAAGSPQGLPIAPCPPGSTSITPASPIN